ncbi:MULTISPECIES: hypothetical protein [unclassified Sphingopyxis]|uniref:hypothetical protein n=1 Tax=unclassified Sphingopyxis TaxID=2614943 RepID=UPI0007375A30|nr:MULTISPECIES: hypothetical protein [unclassified Sphingopyxis]KTE39795.1 hypothetical protein ATE62_08685 [Sphingopyxis sp. HIX]KTE84846.1 hypothetical protein ATE72_06670 [Sphingopyxis sp. HXXIV]
MRLILILLSACVALAVVKAAIVALIILFAIALIWGVCLHPKEVMGFLAFCAALSLLKAHPLPSLLIVGAAIIATQVGGFAKERPDDS